MNRTMPIKSDSECECGSSSFQRCFDSGEVDFLRCLACGLLFREIPLPESELVDIYRQAYEEEKIATGDTNQESGAFAANVYAAYIHEYLCPQLPEQGRILDYGAGSGELVCQLRQRGFTIDGLEFSSEARHFCERHRGFSLKASLRNVSDKHYSLVSMIEVIEHLTELQGTLKEIHRVLAPGGLLLVTTPNRHGWRARMEGGHWREARKKFHLFLFDASSLRFHLNRVGFVDIQRIRFSPVQRDGLKFWLVARLMQIAGLGGTLCMIAKVQGNKR